MKQCVIVILLALYPLVATAQEKPPVAQDDFASPEALLKNLPTPPPAPSPLPQASASPSPESQAEPPPMETPSTARPPTPQRKSGNQPRKLSEEIPQSDGRSATAAEKGKVNLDYVNVEVGEIAKSISELTNKNFILDENVRGRITIISPRPVTIAEAYQAFISALEVKNLTVVRAGKMLKIVPLKDMKSTPIPTDVSFAEGGDDIFVTRLVPLQYISTAEIVKSLRGLISRNGDMISYDPTNTLILTDSVSNVRRILKIIEKLDQQGYQQSLEVIRLKYASAIETVDKINRIFDITEQRSGAPAAGKGAAQDASKGSQFISKLIPDERTNSIIVLANAEGVTRIREVIEKLDQGLEEETQTGSVHVHYLQYADATELAATLGFVSSAPVGGARSTRGGASNSNDTIFTRAQGARTRNTQANVNQPTRATTAQLFGGEIQITPDVATNSLVIIASGADYKALLPVIRRLDVRRPQAFIESMILEVNIDKAFEMGVSAHLGKQFGGTDPTTLFGATSFGSSSSVFLPADPTGLQGLNVGLQGKTIDIPIAGGETLSIPLFGSLFRTLQTNGTINVLATPNILTSDNIEAEIVIGQVVPFITAQGRDINNQPINQIQRENVALTLRVTPQINESADITMDIFMENQDLVPGPGTETFGPTTSKRSTKTTVLVKDSQTVTVGGLISERESDAVSKVPVLGDIPLLGWLFKNKSRRRQKTSLAIFLTPHIVREPRDLARMTIEKNDARKDFLEENNIREHGGLKKYKLDRDLRVPVLKNEAQAPVPPDSPSGGFLSRKVYDTEPVEPPPSEPGVMNDEGVPGETVEQPPVESLEGAPAPQAPSEEAPPAEPPPSQEDL